MTSNKQLKAEKYLKWLTFMLAIFFLAFWFWRLGDSLWSDEAFTGIILGLSPREIISTIMNENNPPLYYLLVYPFKLLLGSSEFVLRLPSLLFGLATLMLLRYEFRSRPVLRELVSIFALLNSNLYYTATEARYYSLFTLLYLASFLLMQRLVTRSDLKIKLGYVLVSTLLLYSHSLGLILFVLNTLFILVPDIQDLYHKFSLRSLVSTMQARVFLLLPALFYLPWFFVLLRQIRMQRELDFWLEFHPFYSLKHVFAIIWNPGVNHGKIYEVLFTMPPWLVVCFAVVISAVVLFFLYALKRNYSSKLGRYLLPFWAVAAMYLSSFFFPLFFGRYFSFLFPFTAILTAAGLVQVAKSYGSKLAVAAGALVAFSFVVFLILFYSYPTKMPIREFAAVAELEPDSLVTTYDEYQYLSCLYYFSDCRLLYGVDEIDQNIGVSLFPYIKSLKQIPADVDRVYVLNNDRYAPKTDYKLQGFVLQDCTKYGSEIALSEHLSVCQYVRLAD